VGGASRIDPEEEAGAQWFNPANSPLPAADVRVVQPGIDGAMWFGSEGVTLYDGAAWTTFTTDDGLAGATVQAIAIDDRTRTWIGTQSGLSIWTGSAFFNLTTDNGLPSDDITALLAQDDIIWIGTRGGGLLRFQENQLQVFTRENIGLPSNVITALALDAEGVLFVGTDRGLASFQDSEMTPLAEFADMPVSALAAGAGKVWVATADSALFYTEGDGWLPFATAHLPGRPITTLLVDSAGGLWVGCDQGGLAYFGP
jgi:ligand-binding sensor domain-containing protein